MIAINDKRDCCGCSACATACPKQCISMEEDNEGFLYPIIDKNKCIDCSLCEKVCPILHAKPEEKKTQRAYIVQHKDAKVLRESTSGGAFTAIAKWVLDKGGVVFGAGFNEDFEVIHQPVESYEELNKFRNSKYVQSRINGTYQQAKELLAEGRFVCFSGTPCQLEGLFSYLRKPYENLITVDVVCRACPSPLVLRKYLKMQQAKLQMDLQDVKFRDKHHGYKYSTMSLLDKKQCDYHQGIDTDYYLRSFFGGYNVRPSCSKCSFRKRFRNTDFTLWDCFDVDKFNRDFDNDKGVTRILTHSQQADLILNESVTQLNIFEINPDKAVEGVREMYHSVSVNSKRESFFHDLNTMDAELCFQKYFPITMRHRIEKQVRLWSARLGIYKHAKKIFKMLYGQKEIRR